MNEVNENDTVRYYFGSIQNNCRHSGTDIWYSILISHSYNLKYTRFSWTILTPLISSALECKIASLLPQNTFFKNCSSSLSSSFQSLGLSTSSGFISICYVSHLCLILLWAVNERQPLGTHLPSSNWCPLQQSFSLILSKIKHIFKPCTHDHATLSLSLSLCNLYMTSFFRAHDTLPHSNACTQP
jgi:hypothetical protein